MRDGATGRSRCPQWVCKLEGAARLGAAVLRQVRGSSRSGAAAGACPPRPNPCPGGGRGRTLPDPHHQLGRTGGPRYPRPALPPCTERSRWWTAVPCLHRPPPHATVQRPAPRRAQAGRGLPAGLMASMAQLGREGSLCALCGCAAQSPRQICPARGALRAGRTPGVKQRPICKALPRPGGPTAGRAAPRLPGGRSGSGRIRQ